MTPADVAFASVSDRARVLLRNLDGTVRHDPPFLLACECDGHALDLAIRRVSTVAFTLAAIISAIVLLRAAPLPIGAIALFWVIAAGSARVFAKKRRRQHGRFLVDFERDVLSLSSADGIRREVALGGGTKVRVEESVDAQAPYWLLLRAPDGIEVRLARGKSEELTSVLQVFRSYNYDVNRRVLDQAEAD